MNQIPGTATVTVMMMSHLWPHKLLRMKHLSISHNHQLCGILLRLLINMSKSTKMEYQRAPKNKPTAHCLCGRSSHLGGSKTLLRVVNILKHETFVTMTEEAMLPKFITEVMRSDGNLHPPNGVYQISDCCSVSLALRSANRREIDIFNSPKLSQFRDTLDTCMKL